MSCRPREWEGGHRKALDEHRRARRARVEIGTTHGVHGVHNGHSNMHDYDETVTRHILQMYKAGSAQSTGV